MINLIWAMDENWLVGNNNSLPWRYPKDLLYFKTITSGKNVLMGHNTYKSMKQYYKDKPFPFAKIYVATSKKISYDDCIIINDVEFFLKNNDEELFVIGGPKIYDIALLYANRLYITFILDSHIGNVYFTKFNLANFNLKSYHNTDKLIFALYERREK